MRISILLSAFVVFAALACDQSTTTQSHVSPTEQPAQATLGKTYKLQLSGMM